MTLLRKDLRNIENGQAITNYEVDSCSVAGMTDYVSRNTHDDIRNTRYLLQSRVLIDDLLLLGLPELSKFAS